jgi:predicted nucleic acid-binding protein
MSLVYLDTSVLVKRYLPERESDAVDAFLDDPAHRFVVSDLCVVELESAITRRARQSSGVVPREKLRLRIDDDMRGGFFLVHTLNTAVLIEARQWIAEGEPLATLDALHLATALHAGAEVFASDDRQLQRAARAAGFNIHSFL